MSLKRNVTVGGELLNISFAPGETLVVTLSRKLDTFQLISINGDKGQVYNDVIELTFLETGNRSRNSPTGADIIVDYYAKDLGYIGSIDKECLINSGTAYDDSLPVDQCSDIGYEIRK